MPDQKSQRESPEEKREVELRDLKPKLDPKGGATNEKKEEKDDKRASGRKGEADFMKGLK